MAISNLLSASTCSRTGRPRPLSSYGILAFPGGSQFLPRFHFSLPGNGRELGGGDDDLPSGGGGWGIGGEECSNAGTEGAMALQESTKEGNDTVPTCLGSAVSAIRINPNGKSNDEIGIIMSHDRKQTQQNDNQKINDSLERIINLLEQSAKDRAEIIYLLKKNVNKQSRMANVLARIANSLTKMANVLARIANSLTKMANVLDKMMNCMTTMMNYGFPVPGVANSSRDDDLVNMRKGLLGFTYTITDKMILAYGLLATLSLTDPHGKVSDDDILKKVICLANVMSYFGSVVMSAFASNFKESELTGNGGFEIFIWLLLLELLAFITECFITIGVFTHINTIWVLCLAGVTCFCSTALMWAVYYERPKFLNEWIKKMGCFLWGRTASLPEREQQVQTGENQIP